MDEFGEARLIQVPQYLGDDDGLLVVTESGKHVSFQIERMFSIVAPSGAKRGRHAHRLCSQFLMCVTGSVNVVCDDGTDRKMFSLDRPELALFVPSGLWLEIDAAQDNSVIIVLCDRLYEEANYINNYAEFLSFRKAPRA